MNEGMTGKVVAVMVVGMVGLAAATQAATNYWSGATSGNMSGTPNNWSGSLADPGSADIAAWDAATYVNAPTANASMTLGALWFTANNTAGVTFGGGTGTLTLNGVSGIGIQVDSGSGAINTGGATFKIGANQSWLNNSSQTLNINGTVNNSGNTTPYTMTIDGTGNTALSKAVTSGTVGTLSITKTGTGVLSFNAMCSLGNLTINQGKVTLSANTSGSIFGSATAYLGDITVGNSNSATISSSYTSGKNNNNYLVVNPGSTGTLALLYAQTAAGHTFTWSGGVALSNALTLASSGNANNTLVLSSVISGTSGLNIGTTDISNLGTVSLTGANTYSGGLVVNSGSLTLLNDQSAATGSLSLGTTNGAATTLNIGSATQTAATSVKVGATKAIQVGANTTAGVGTSTEKLNVAGTSGYNTTVTNDGTLLAGRASVVTIGSYSTWNQNNSMTIQAQGGYSATLTVYTNGTFTYAGSTAINMQPGGSLNGDAFLTIVGGTFTTAQGFNLGAGGGPPFNRYGIITLSGGGMLRLSGAIPSLTTINSTGLFKLGAGGGTIDTAGFDTTLSTVLTNATAQIGSLIKSGAGTLALTNAITYSGATTVSNGVLDVSSATAFASTNWTIAALGTLKRGATNLAGKNLAVGVDGANAGLLDVTGNLTLGGNLTVTGSSSGSRKIAQATGTISGTFSTTSLPSGFVLTLRNSSKELWVGYPGGTIIRFF